MKTYESLTSKESTSSGHQQKYKSTCTTQCKGYKARTSYPLKPIMSKSNESGLPSRLKEGAENLSGYSLDDVRVHYHSDKPAGLHALAYTRGNEIYVGPGQEKHLPHETWHVVQQKQGRVKPTMQWKGNVPVNDDKALEQEADAMGSRAAKLLLNRETTPAVASRPDKKVSSAPMNHNPLQMQWEKLFLFFREFTAGMGGYGSHYFRRPPIGISPAYFKDPVRRQFHMLLMGLFKSGLTQRWAHQLMFQNLVQYQFGTKLPMEAMMVMITALQNLGTAAQKGASRKVLAKHFLQYQIGSIQPFLKGGSSLAPALMHVLGAGLQLPAILMGGARWVNRPGFRPVLSPLGVMPWLLAPIFYNMLNWYNKKKT